MQIWVDADACPVAIREILCRAANRCEIEAVFVANQPVSLPRSQYLRFQQAPRGFDAADDEIAERAKAGDLVITSDIPLAARIIEHGATALSPRGERFTEHNIQGRLSMRDFMETLRNSGVDTGGPSKMTQADRHAFACELEKFLP